MFLRISWLLPPFFKAICSGATAYKHSSGNSLPRASPPYPSKPSAERPGHRDDLQATDALVVYLPLETKFSDMTHPRVDKAMDAMAANRQAILLEAEQDMKSLRPTYSSPGDNSHSSLTQHQFNRYMQDIKQKSVGELPTVEDIEDFFWIIQKCSGDGKRPVSFSYYKRKAFPGCLAFPSLSRGIRLELE
ncbi:hypothetical protein CDEST_03159 [Colletotrichum destructivum]|uniref:Uncharacterized protein n=1 Tax=Colletotrichum destructivum TaxID=34406 RepID=A0AAX4I478_9PEZI|nr:hypothetical protein CDEST_03159 [Colletotrichum destructivum]